MELLWILPLIVGAVLWAAADVISDGVIGESHAGPTSGSNKKTAALDDPEIALDLLSDQQGDARAKLEKDGATEVAESEIKLTGEQDALLSGIVMFMIGVLMHYYYGSDQVFAFMNIDHQQRLNDGITMIASSTVYWSCLISGIFQAFSLIYLLKAFESSSSTVIVPLIQLNSVKFILLSALGELFSLSGYFFVSISYHLYYNSGVVSATEGALNQLFNLILAIILKKFFNFGRDVKRIKEKLYSCIIVTIGLVLTST
ncbi:hypothetical protein PPL_07103 [Heterostelium album PN500]|uniref:Uncharacterized protein n=1 Tax=Heterostelium pallidum (strain ATCC 26659 / Pp 5 / PN500) TaxID=670386 RepID=D3BEE5_HETP5|nr:hypothetical protein PPL_07103 [Heterostelium album PN500]EFA80276.1 hypothetical protein PPL_07103 [Heterostelium album PN500]|eukprot:XP_020432396.1 hypothetical protein PPL_07103 [Heterostelium album PN500]